MLFKKIYLTILLPFLFIVHVTKAQVANFQADVTSGCPSTTVNFTDQSTGATSWAWDFGNGNTSTQQNPSAVYTDAGTYTVVLNINGGGGSKTKTLTNYITIYGNPSVNFTSNVTTGCYPLSVQFTDTSTPGTSSSSLSTTSWVFGDGGTSGNNNPLYVYNLPSSYTVTLTVTNEHTCQSTVSKTNYITAKGAKVNFTADHTSYCQAPATVNFTNQSTGQAPFSYVWDFGDGTATSSQTNPSHTYASAGNYTVKLTTTDASGCPIVATKNNYIAVSNQTGIDFSFSPAQACIGQTVTFADLTSLPVISRSWDFGNGQTSAGTNPTTSYNTVGIYTVKLTESLSSGCVAVVSKSIEVLFDAAPNFTTVAACGQKVSFTNTSQFASSYFWDFGDGQTSYDTDPVHIYSSSGKYTVKLTAYNSLNCPIVFQKDVTVYGDPVAVIYPDQQNSCTDPSLSGCAPFTIQFTNKSQSDLTIKSIQWLFGDNTNSTTASPQHTYTNAGTYNVMLVIVNTANCRDTARAVVNVSSTTPTVGFTADKTSVCMWEAVTFSSTSQNADYWCWDFGDGNKETVENPVHKYNAPGKYTVTLTAKNAGCSNQIVKQDFITVKDPAFGFDVAPINCSSPFDRTVSNTSSNYDSFKWDFGDGTTNTTTATNLFHHYTAPGTYAIRLTIKNDTQNCVVDSAKTVYVQQVQAGFSFDNNPVCKNNPVTLTDQSKYALSWSWDFDDGVTSTLQSPVTSYTTAGTYNVKLTVTDINACTSTQTWPLKVADMQAAFSYTAVSDCNDLQVTFTDASQGNPPIQSWLWNFGDGATSTNENPVHTYHTLQSYTVKITLTNSDAVCSLSTVNAVNFTNPIPDFTASKSPVCLNEVVAFTNNTVNAQFFTWDFGNGQTANTPAPTQAYSQPGAYSVTLAATDQYGCEKDITKTDYIQVQQPKAQFEAFQTSAECPPLITTFKDLSSTDVTTWAWTFGDGQSSTFQNPTNTYQIPGIFDVTLQVTNQIGCIDQVTLAGLVSVGGPYGHFQIDTQPICIDQSIQFDATTTNTVLYTWDFGDGTVVNTDQSSIQHTYTAASNFKSSLTLQDDKGCRVTVGANTGISVIDKPPIDFTINSDYAFENEPIKFVASTDQFDLSWTFDSETEAGGVEIEKSFDHFGKHHVTLDAVNKTGCSNAVEKDVIIQADLGMIPNIITANNTDTLNSTLKVNNITDGFWSLSVYNRWGTKVYHSDTYKNEWDGGGLSSGVYYYLFTNQYRTDKKYKGYVQLMK